MPSRVCPQCGIEYDLDQQFCPADGAALLAQASESDFTGRIFGGRYRLLKRLGAGGMGNVYLAEHVRLKKLAAVKVIRSAMTVDAGAVARFNREAQNASMVNHPNVATVFDFGEGEGGIVFLAMEFVDGEPLSGIIGRGPLPPERTSRIVAQIAEALTAAHRMGVVHRDLKPDNVMVTPSPDGSDFVKLVDFGISKVSNTGDQNITATGMVIGTPTYMSPEQARGSSAVDSRSDIYSLGVLTFQALTAALPFKGDTPQEQMVSRLIESPASLSTVRPDVAWAPAVERVLSKALAAQPEDRYATAQDFARALEGALRASRRTAGLTPTVAVAAISSELTTASAERARAAASGSSTSAAADTSKVSASIVAPARWVRWGAVAGIAASVVILAGAGLLVIDRQSTGGSGSRSALPASSVEQDAAAAVNSISRVTNPAPVAENAAPSGGRAPARAQPARDAELQPDVRPQGSESQPSSSAAPRSGQPLDFTTALESLAEAVREPGGPPARYRLAYARSTVLLRHSTTPADSVRVLFYQSRALALLGNRAAGCQSLAQATTIARGGRAAKALERVSERMQCE